MQEKINTIILKIVFTINLLSDNIHLTYRLSILYF